MALGVYLIPEMLPDSSCLSQYCLLPFSPNLIPSVSIQYPHLDSSPIQGQHLFYFTFTVRILSPLPLSPHCYLASLGLWIVTWFSFTLWLTFTYEWVYAMFSFWGLGYLTQCNDKSLFQSHLTPATMWVLSARPSEFHPLPHKVPNNTQRPILVTMLLGNP